MHNHVTRLIRGLRSDRGEVGSWLILAAGLALAAALAATLLGGVIGSLSSNVAEAAGVGATSGAPGDGSPTLPDPPDGPTGGAPGDGSPTLPDPPDEPTGGAPGDGSPTLPDPPDEPTGGAPGDGSPTLPDPPDEPTSDDCYLLPWSSCTTEGACIADDALACSRSPIAQDAYTQHWRYEQCSQGSPPLHICTNQYIFGFEPGIRALFEAELGANPGDFFRMAASICDSGGPGCETWSRLAEIIFENRSVIATAIIVGDIIPSPRGVGCLPSVLDGSITGGEATECAIGIGSGLGIPLPSSAIDEVIQDDLPMPPGVNQGDG